MTAPPPMDLARLKALIDLAASSRLGEIDVTENGIRVRIRRHAAAAADAVAERVVPPVATGAAAPAVPRRRAAPASGAHVVASPMYGIFHRAPSPDAAPFVELGRSVRRGDRLCLIEAMKVFNVVEADADGTVSEILAENGQEVELCQGLFRIAP